MLLKCFRLEDVSEKLMLDIHCAIEGAPLWNMSSMD